MQIGMSQNYRLDVSTEISIMLNPRMLQMLNVLNLPYNELVEEMQRQSETNPMLEIEKRDTLIDYLRLMSNTPYKESAGGKEKADLEDYLKRGASLEEHLIAQLGLVECPEQEKEACSQLIGSLDTNGYLADFDRVKDEIKQRLCVDDAVIESALDILQSFEPEGIGCRDAKECLMIQVRQYNFENEALKETLEKAITQHLDDIAEKNFAKISSSLGISAEGAEQICDFIKNNLNPLPGASFSERSAPAIPSFAAEKTSSGFKAVNLESKYGPVMKINRQYLKMMDDPSANEQTRDFIREKLERAKDFLENIAKRHETTEKIVQMLLDRQKDFLEGGRGHMEPVTQKDISDKFGIHPSTVSRAIAGKYIETPKGVIKIKSLCRYNVKGRTKEQIQEIIRGILSKEEQQRPLHDREIRASLSALGIDLDRRTVADYRKQMGIDEAKERQRQ